MHSKRLTAVVVVTVGIWLGGTGGTMAANEDVRGTAAQAAGPLDEQLPSS